MKLRMSWLGVALIVIGAILVLERMSVLHFSWREVFWGVLALASVIKIGQGFATSVATRGVQGRGRIFWWTILGSFACYKFFYHIGMFDPTDPILFACMLMAIGTGILIMFLSWPREWHVAIPAVIVLGLGITVYLSEMGYIYRWDVLHTVRTYWPVALILFGAALLMNRKRTV